MSAERLNLTTYDFRLQNEGTILVLHPQNDAAGDWCQEHIVTEEGIPPIMWGGGYVIDHSCVADIARGIEEEGWTLGPMR